MEIFKSNFTAQEIDNKLNNVQTNKYNIEFVGGTIEDKGIELQNISGLPNFDILKPGDILSIFDMFNCIIEFKFDDKVNENRYIVTSKLYGLNSQHIFLRDIDGKMYGVVASLEDLKLG